MKTVTVKNTFHNTYASFRTDSDSGAEELLKMYDLYKYADRTGFPRYRTFKRVMRTLCPSSDCECGLRFVEDDN